VVALNRAVAVAEVDAPEAALELVDELDLDGYYLFHAIRADLLRRVGRDADAARAYDAAIARTETSAERAFSKAEDARWRSRRRARRRTRRSRLAVRSNTPTVPARSDSTRPASRRTFRWCEIVGGARVEEGNELADADLAGVLAQHVDDTIFPRGGQERPRCGDH